MASKVSGYIGKINPGNGTQYSLGSTAYGYCETAAATAAKTVDMTGFILTEGATIFIKFKYNNTATDDPTLNVNSTGAKPLIPKTWYAGAILSLTYDGTSWIQANAYLDVSVITTGTLPTARGGTGATSYRINSVIVGSATPTETGGTVASQLTWVQSKSGALYSTGINEPTQFGTLPVAQGGTGNTSYTANRMIYSESTAKLSASGHYASSDKIAIHSTSEPSATLYVNGTSEFTNQIYLNNTSDAAAGSDNGAMVIGDKTGVNLAFDSNEIMARNNSTASTLYLNTDGGLVRIGSGGLASGGTIYPTTDKTIDLGSATARWQNMHVGYISTYPLNGGTITQYNEILCKNNSKNLVGALIYDSGSATNVTTGRWIFQEYSPNSTANTSTTGKCEWYQLPIVTTGLTEVKKYDILTSKNAVTIDQGGTGATTAAAARTNLGAIAAVSATGISYTGMATPDGDASSWIRVPSTGLLPYEPGGAGGGHSRLGTTNWRFSSAFIDTITSSAVNSSTFYFGVPSFGGESRAAFVYSSAFPYHGIWYFDETNDAMTLDVHGKANSKTEADLAIGALGAGIISTRNRYIPHTNNTTGTVGTQYIPVYVNAGTITQITTNSVLTNLGSTTAASTYAASPRPGVTGTLPIANGGTGATTRLAAAKNLTNENITSPGYVVSLTQSWANFGYTSINNLKTTLGMPQMQIVSYTGNNTVSMSITFDFAPDIIICLNPALFETFGTSGDPASSPTICDMSKVTTSWQSVHFGNISQAAIGMSYAKSFLDGIVVCSKSSNGRIYYVKIDTAYVNTLPSEVKAQWSAGATLGLAEMAVYNRSGMVTRFLGIKF